MSSFSSKHDPVGSVIPTMRAQLLTVKDVIDAVRLSRAAVSSPKARTRKPLPANARGIGCTSDRDRDRVLLHRVDPGYRNAPPGAFGCRTIRPPTDFGNRTRRASTMTMAMDEVLTAGEVSRMTGIPVSTLHDWAAKRERG